MRRTTKCWMLVFFFFNDTATTEIYTLSLHDALPILPRADGSLEVVETIALPLDVVPVAIEHDDGMVRSEEHTSELQSRQYLVCRLLLEKKKTILLLLNICIILRQHNTSI